MGAVGGAITGELHVRQGGVGTVIAREAHLQQSVARAVVGYRVTMGPQSAALIVIARQVDGQVRAFLDWRAGAAFGVVFGLVVAVLGRRRR
jgi:hypothetical protein